MGKGTLAMLVRRSAQPKIVGSDLVNSKQYLLIIMSILLSQKMNVHGGAKIDRVQRSLAPSSRPGTSVQVLAQRKSSNNGNSKGAVTYGNDWYQQTRDAMNTKRTVREEMEMRRKANRAANNGKERKDLYTDNWDGDVYKGSSVNILSVLIVVSIVAPIIGLIFALQTYGTLWG